MRSEEEIRNCIKTMNCATDLLKADDLDASHISEIIYWLEWVLDDEAD